MRLSLKKVFGGIIVLALFSLGLGLVSRQTSALSGSEFNAGRIIGESLGNLLAEAVNVVECR